MTIRAYDIRGDGKARLNFRRAMKYKKFRQAILKARLYRVKRVVFDFDVESITTVTIEKYVFNTKSIDVNKYEIIVKRK